MIIFAPRSWSCETENDSFRKMWVSHGKTRADGRSRPLPGPSTSWLHLALCRGPGRSLCSQPPSGRPGPRLRRPSSRIVRTNHHYGREAKKKAVQASRQPPCQLACVNDRGRSRDGRGTPSQDRPNKGRVRAPGTDHWKCNFTYQREGPQGSFFLIPHASRY